jgi:peptidase E
MNNIEKKIIAIGGGGFTHQLDLSLDQFVIDKLKSTNNKIGFLATASKDDEKKISLFYKRFENTEFELSHFNLTTNINGFSEWIMSKDLVYIGGGNTVFMLEIWRKNKLEHIFIEAYEKGIILSGISDGAVCWFDWILSDAVGPGFNPLRGINLISGSCTPHSSNIERINQFESDIKSNKLPQCVAIDDGVAVGFVDGKPSEVYSSRKNHTAYFLDKNQKINLNEYIKNI